MAFTIYDKPSDWPGPGRFVVFQLNPVRHDPENAGKYIASRLGGFHTLKEAKAGIESAKKSYGDTFGGLIDPTSTKGMIFKIYEATYTEIEETVEGAPVKVVPVKAAPKRQKRAKPEPKRWGASVSYGLLTADRKRMMDKLAEAGFEQKFGLDTEAEAQAYADKVKQKCGVELHVHKHF